jgi:hypothetical protein
LHASNRRRGGAYEFKFEFEFDDNDDDDETMDLRIIVTASTTPLGVSDGRRLMIYIYY